MALLADHSNLPPRPPRAQGSGLMPDETPRFIGVLVDKWAAEKDDDKPTAYGTRIRHSDAGKCARAISFRAAGFKRSDPMDLSGVFNTTLGTLLHDRWQEALQEAYQEAEVEVKVRWDDLDASGHIDAVIVLDGKTIAYELKSCGGWAYKAAVGKARRGTPAEGPKLEHLLQGALNAVAVDADEMVIGYLSKESLSVNVGAGLPELARMCAEWTFQREDFEPWAEEEKRRMAGILALADDGMLAARKVPALPAGAEIISPKTGAWQVVEDGRVVDTGSYWACAGYCDFRTLCQSTDGGRIPVESVVAIRGTAA